MPRYVNRRYVEHNGTSTGPREESHRMENGRDRANEHGKLNGIGYMYARILSRFWYIICLLVFMTVGAFAAVSLTLFDLPDVTNPSKGFVARGTVISARLAGLINLLEDRENMLTGFNVEEALTMTTATPSFNNTNLPFCSSIGYWDAFVLTLVFEGVDGRNMLTLEAIKSVCEAEKRFVTSHPLYQDYCLCRGNETDNKCPLTWSIGNYVALLSNKTSCEDINESDVDRTVDLLVFCAPFFKGVSPSDLEDSMLSQSVPEECNEHIHTILYYLLPADFSRDILENKIPLESSLTASFLPLSGVEKSVLKAIYKENILSLPDTDGVTRLTAVDAFIQIYLFPDFLLRDTLIVALASVVVFLLIWVYTGSLLVTVAAFLNIVFSLVLAYFFYTAVFLRPFFPFSNIVAMVLLIGVGADDTFVFVDLWKRRKSELSCRNLTDLVLETLRHAALTMFVTSFTTAAALYASVMSDITVVRCFAVFAGTAIVMNLALTLTLLPAIIVMHEKVSRCCGLSYWWSQVFRCKFNKIKSLNKPFERLNKDLVPFLVLKLRYLFIVVFLLLMTGAGLVVFYSPRLNVPSRSDEQFFIDSDYLEQYDIFYKDQFSFNHQLQLPDFVGCVVWGVQAVDNGDWWDPDDRGRLVLDEGFQLVSSEQQTWLLDFCRDLRNQTFFKSSDFPLGCFLEDFITLMQQPCVNPFTGEDASPCCNQRDFPLDPTLFSTCVAKFANLGFLPGVFFNRNTSKVAAVKIAFPTTFPRSYVQASNEEIWQTVNAWVEGQLKSAPDSFQRGWFVPDISLGLNSSEFLFFDLQQSLASGTVSSMLVTLAMASVVLCLTIRNIWLAVWAMLTIASAVFVTVASLVLLGWNLGVVEATIITLAVGLSVDYTIHYGTAYKLSPSTDRRQRSRNSLVTMTPAITMAALTTFLAGSLALFSRVLIFYQFSVFLMLVMVISWSHGTFFFESLCTVFGPEGSCGNLPSLTSCCKCGERNTSESMTTNGSLPSKVKNAKVELDAYSRATPEYPRSGEHIYTISSL
ncbi:protein dispatched homolog 1-like [Acanthaster planci]|uniref:Protein dispatched homolog 1-like n=1 Tax=Acanthaster planci TaxID=133434 RepID=A0A8B7ZD57_ACAPL|nr:protein dispatched homolog 1-like [Acanthaster planci]